MKVIRNYQRVGILRYSLNTMIAAMNVFKRKSAVRDLLRLCCVQSICVRTSTRYVPDSSTGTDKGAMLCVLGALSLYRTPSMRPRGTTSGWAPGKKTDGENRIEKIGWRRSGACGHLKQMIEFVEKFEKHERDAHYRLRARTAAAHRAYPSTTTSS